MTIRIGANPIIWSNDDDHTLGGDIPLEQCLAEARTAGYDGMELGHKFPRTARALRPILDRYGLALVSGWYSTFLLQRDADAELAAAAEHRRLLREMGCTVMIVAECTDTVHSDATRPLSTRPVLSDNDWRRLVPRLTRLADLLAADGLTLAYHHHVGTVIQTGEETDRLMRETGPAVRLLLDTGHATWAGTDPVALARTWHQRIAHMHVKDVRADVAARANAHDWSFLHAVRAGVYTVPGDGAIDFAAVLRALPDYDGWIVVEAEQDPAKAAPAHYARSGREHMARILAGRA
jgi:inosose dehydratase/3D-(3,5/4)-trihydroxycyclohexane-1,2-dione acylhydrolase (decyclizing)